MKKIELLETNNSILKKDENIIDKIYDEFEYDKNTKLIPQCFWGNIKNPKYIILAKNPSNVFSDKLDNTYFNESLIENLALENRNNDVINLLFSEKSFDGIPFELSGVSMWWHNFFGSLITDNNKKFFMDDYCIINLCGYYKTSDAKITKELIWFYDDNGEIDDVVKELFNNENLKKIISLWVDHKIWDEVLKELKVKLKPINAEKKNPFTPYLDKNQLED